MGIRRNIMLQNIQLRGENIWLRKKVDSLTNELSQLYVEQDKELMQLEKDLEKKYKCNKKRYDTLAEDNRRLIIKIRQKDREIASLKQELSKKKGRKKDE